MKTCYIVGAADFAPGRFNPGPDDLIIAADAGCLHLQRLGIKPGLILGDFDSLGYVPDFPDVEVCPVRKDDTDSMIAARRALSHGCDTLLFSDAWAASGSTTRWRTSRRLPGPPTRALRRTWWATGAVWPRSREGTASALTSAIAATSPCFVWERTPRGLRSAA